MYFPSLTGPSRDPVDQPQRPRLRHVDAQAAPRLRRRHLVRLLLCLRQHAGRERRRQPLLALEGVYGRGRVEEDHRGPKGAAAATVAATAAAANSHSGSELNVFFFFLYLSQS